MEARIEQGLEKLKANAVEGHDDSIALLEEYAATKDLGHPLKRQVWATTSQAELQAASAARLALRLDRRSKQVG